MQSSEVVQFIASARNKKDWSPLEFLKFCKESVELARKYPEDKSDLAYWIVEEGRHFADFGTSDPDEARQAIKDLAAELELPDAHIDTSDGTIKQKWSRLEAYVNAVLDEAQSNNS